ncbi:MAG: BlaI/MecI/CopY family transcriptional regulator [Acidobacteriaceae bacterium]|nr:BlaI/MecI/CopY family transcriptional regulator [Acidobacteriaceae bacterium]
MTQSKLSRLEFQVMEILWAREEASIREIHEAIATSGTRKRPPAYTTIQTTVYRIEKKGLVRRVRKVGNFHMFAATVAQERAQRRLLDDFLGLFRGRGKFVMSHLIEAGELTRADIREAEELLKSAEKRRSK